MQSLARDGYSASQVYRALTDSRREFRFRYRLLSVTNNPIGWVDGVTNASIEHNALAQIKRSAKMTFQDSFDIDFSSDRIQPLVGIKMEDGGYAEFPQGIFLLSSPDRAIDSSQSVVREVEAYDQGQVLVDSKIDRRYSFPQGRNYNQAINKALSDAGIVNRIIEETDHSLPVPREWEPGTSFAEIVSDLLEAVNYESLSFDSTGTARSSLWRSPSSRPIDFTYETNRSSVLMPEATQTLDLFDVANHWVLVVSEPDREPLVATYTNEDPNSPTSTVARGRKITDFRESEEASTQQALNARARRLAENASQVFEQVAFQTRMMPFHEHADVIELKYTQLGVNDFYVQNRWEYALRAGSAMSHNIRRVRTL